MKLFETKTELELAVKLIDLIKGGKYHAQTNAYFFSGLVLLIAISGNPESLVQSLSNYMERVKVSGQLGFSHLMALSKDKSKLNEALVEINKSLAEQYNGFKFNINQIKDELSKVINNDKSYEDTLSVRSVVFGKC